MSSEALLSSVIPFAGNGLLGYAMGFALKKVLKWLLIIVGFLAGMFFVGVQLLQRYGYVSTVNWDKLGNDTSTQIQHWASIFFSNKSCHVKSKVYSVINLKSITCISNLKHLRDITLVLVGPQISCDILTTFIVIGILKTLGPQEHNNLV